MKQSSGNNSINIQAGESVNLNLGLNREQVKEVCFELFEQNFLKLSEDAMKLADDRVREFTNKFIDNLYKRNDPYIHVLKDPGFQSALYGAQCSYAKSGDEDLESQLLELLNLRMQSGAQGKRNLQLYLDEALNLVSRLSEDQIQSLTLVHFFLNVKNYEAPNSPYDSEFLRRLIDKIKVLRGKEALLRTNFLHLASIGCCTLLYENKQILDIENIIRTQFPFHFSKGFSKEELIEFTNLKFEVLKGAVCPLLPGHKQLRFIFRDYESLSHYLRKNNLENSEFVFKSFVEGTSIDSELLWKLMIEIDPDIKKISDEWEKSIARNYVLSPAGAMIANQNIKKVLGLDFKIS